MNSMNKKSQGEEIVVYAVIFVILFIIGGFVGVISLPEILLEDSS